MRIVRLLLFASLLFIISCNSRSDRDIELEASEKVHPSAPNITLSVKNGVMYLSGMVRDSASWKATIEAARSVRGVKSVDDKLHIDGGK